MFKESRPNLLSQKRGYAMDNKQKEVRESLRRPTVIASTDVAKEVSREKLFSDNEPKKRKKRDWILFVPESGPTDNQLT